MPYVALAHAGRVHYAERGERRAGPPVGGADSRRGRVVGDLDDGAGARRARRARDRDRSARARAERRRGRGARRRARADRWRATATPSASWRARCASARRCWSAIRWARWSRSRRRSPGPTRCAAWCCARRRRACPSIPSWRALLRDDPRARDRRGWPSTRCRRARSPPIRRGFLAAGDVTPRRGHARRLRDRARHRPRRAHRRARLPGHLARRRRRSHRARRPKDARARSSRCPTSAT